MAAETTNLLTTDVYLAHQFVNDLKERYVDISEDTLFLGMYGYLSSVFGNLIQNTATKTAEYSMEAIPTKAKFEKNIISHALALGINKIHATPAEVDIMLAFPEETLINNMTNGVCIIDKESTFNIGESMNYEYHLDYDIHIKRVTLPNGNHTYRATYDIDGKNKISSLTNPYLPSIGLIYKENQSLIALRTILHQTTHNTIYKKVIVDNPLENKTLTFEFENQLAFFYVEVVEEGSTDVIYLEPVYEGLFDYTSDDKYVNYMYVDEKTIRIKFNRASYTPRVNAEITVHVYTTLGEVCNFALAEYEVVDKLKSDTYGYNGLYYYLKTGSDSQYAEDRYDIEKLKQIIPKEYMARSSIATYTDLNNFFNIVQTENCRMTFLRKVHNQNERLYYCYLLLKSGNNMIPTNTIKVNFIRNMFNSISKMAFIIKPGSIFYMEKDGEEAEGIYELNAQEAADMDESGFLYLCPYLIVINKTPFYVSYYNVLINYERNMYFEFINDASDLQFVALTFHAYRNYFDNRTNATHIELDITQNINTDYDLIAYDSEGNIQEENVAIYMIIYNKDEDDNYIPYRYCRANLLKYDNGTGTFTFDFVLTTNNVIAYKSAHMYYNTGLYTIETGRESPAYLDKTVYVKFFILAKMDQKYGRMFGEQMENDLDTLIPSLDEWTLTNIYNASDLGLDLFYDYTDFMNSYIAINKMDDGNFKYLSQKIPVVRYTWFNSEERVQDLMSAVDYRRRFVQETIVLLEDSFGIDYKFYNTYGRSITYNIENKTKIDRINLRLEFEIRFSARENATLIPSIKTSIKDYIEDMNNITDLHMSNLIVYITNLYREDIDYIKFVKLNEYDSLYQSIYKDPELGDNYFKETQIVPEFINVNTLNNGEVDIVFDVIESY